MNRAERRKKPQWWGNSGFDAALKEAIEDAMAKPPEPPKPGEKTYEQKLAELRAFEAACHPRLAYDHSFGGVRRARVGPEFLGQIAQALDADPTLRAWVYRAQMEAWLTVERDNYRFSQRWALEDANGSAKRGELAAKIASRMLE